DPAPVLVAGPEDTGTCCEALTYEPPGGVPPGVYQVEICQTPNTMGVPQMPPFNYAGTFTYDDSPVPNAELPSPRWNYFFANPLLDYSSTDVRKIGCWSLDGTLIPGCDRDE